MSDLFSGKLSQLLKIARDRNKQAFVDPAAMGKAAQPPGGMDPMMGGGGAPPMDPMMGGGGAPPMDPMMGGGGAPPMDPAMMGMDPAMMGMDPAMMGGAPPPPPGGGGGVDPESIRAIIKEELSASGLTGSDGASQGPTGQIKPKVDVNVELLQIKKMVARLSDAMGINIPAADMVATPEDLTAMAAGGGGGDAGGAMGPGAIPPIGPMMGAMPEPKAAGYLGNTLGNLSDRASAMAHVMGKQRA
jgi:hypothetical protein